MLRLLRRDFSYSGSKYGSGSKGWLDLVNGQPQSLGSVSLIGDTGHFFNKCLFLFTGAGPADMILPAKLKKST